MRSTSVRGDCRRRGGDIRRLRVSRRRIASPTLTVPPVIRGALPEIRWVEFQPRPIGLPRTGGGSRFGEREPNRRSRRDFTLHGSWAADRRIAARVCGHLADAARSTVEFNRSLPWIPQADAGIRDNRAAAERRCS